MLEIKNISVMIDKNPILDGVDFTVDKGEVLVLLGPNGAGKSTLLQTAAGLLKPTSGKIVFSDRPSLDELAYRRRISTVFQSPLLLSDTVENNIACGLRFRGFSRTEIRTRVQLWMNKLHISHLARRQAHTLSGGEAQRVSLARAFCLETELILMDEPFSSLDTPTRRELVSELRHVFSETNQTCLYVTHDLEEALALADRIAVIIDGKIHQLDSSQNVFLRPATPEVARFVGVDNVIPGRVIANKEGLLQIESAGSLIEAVGDYRQGSQVFVCLRPEDITLLPITAIDQASSARNRLNSKITQINLQGPFARIQLDAGAQLTCLVTYPSVKEMDLKIGDQVQAVFKTTAIHLLPAGKKSR